jgi:hypothetical protein
MLWTKTDPIDGVDIFEAGVNNATLTLNTDALDYDVYYKIACTATNAKGSGQDFYEFYLNRAPS